MQIKLQGVNQFMINGIYSMIRNKTKAKMNS